MCIKQDVHAEVGYIISGTAITGSKGLQLHLMSVLHAAQYWYFIFSTFFPRYLCFSGGHQFTAHAQYLTWPDAIWVQFIERNLCGTLNRSKVDTCSLKDFNPNGCSRSRKCSHSKGLINKSLEQTGLCSLKHQKFRSGQFSITIFPPTPLRADKIYQMISPFCNSHRGFCLSHHT